MCVRHSLFFIERKKYLFIYNNVCGHTVPSMGFLNSHTDTKTYKGHREKEIINWIHFLLSSLYGRMTIAIGKKETNVPNTLIFDTYFYIYAHTQHFIFLLSFVLATKKSKPYNIIITMTQLDSDPANKIKSLMDQTYTAMIIIKWKGC